MGCRILRHYRKLSCILRSAARFHLIILNIGATSTFTRPGFSQSLSFDITLQSSILAPQNLPTAHRTGLSLRILLVPEQKLIFAKMIQSWKIATIIAFIFDIGTNWPKCCQYRAFDNQFISIHIISNRLLYLVFSTFNCYVTSETEPIQLRIPIIPLSIFLFITRFRTIARLMFQFNK